MLTDRERQVLMLLANGHTTRTIATTLDISVRTAENHCAAIRNKMAVKTASQAVHTAWMEGIFTLDGLNLVASGDLVS